jgi:predicted acylesterase/phospholipase RssA/CRP-like cAMP-binding protein
MEQKLVLLRRHPIAEGLTDEEIDELANACQQVEFPTGEVLHVAGNRVAGLYLIGQGRFRQTITDQGGKQILQSFLQRGDQFGGLSAVRDEAVPITVTAVEPSIVLKLDYAEFLEQARRVPRLLVNFIHLIGDVIKQTLRIDRVHRHPKVVMVIHDSNASRPLTRRLVDRLQQLDEKPCLITDEDSWRSRPDVPSLMLEENGQPSGLGKIRQQVAEWSARERIFIDIAAVADEDMLIRGIRISDIVLVCIRPASWQETARRLRILLDHEPRWREKIYLVWILDRNQLHPPVAAELAELVAGDFKISFDEPPAEWGNVWKHGVERIVHELRGVRLGIALGGGAARGMAHLGVLKTLEENGIIIDMMAGTSAGAMTGTVYATGMDLDYAVQCFVRDLTPSWLFRRMPGGGYWYLLYKYRRRQFDPMLRKYLSDLRLEQLPIPMNNITVDLVSGKPKVRDQGDAVQGIVESFNLPGLSPPICHHGEALVDGGLVNNVPADVLVSKGCNFVIAVSVTAKLEQSFGRIRPDDPGPKYKVPSSLQTIMRGYLVQSVNMNSVGVQPADLVIEPDVTTFDLSEFTRTDELAAVGSETTAAAIGEIRRSLANIDEQLFRAR